MIIPMYLQPSRANDYTQPSDDVREPDPGDAQLIFALPSALRHLYTLHIGAPRTCGVAIIVVGRPSNFFPDEDVVRNEEKE